MEMVDSTHVFKFAKLCPYCDGDLHYQATEWADDGSGLWMAETIESTCSQEPDIFDNEEWEFWLQTHTDMPYVHQLPIDERVLKHINDNYRFYIS